MNKWHKANGLDYAYIRLNIRQTSTQWALDIWRGWGCGKDGGPTCCEKDIMYYTNEKGAIKSFNLNKKRWCE